MYTEHDTQATMHKNWERLNEMARSLPENILEIVSMPRGMKITKRYSNFNVAI